MINKHGDNEHLNNKVKEGGPHIYLVGRCPGRVRALTFA